MRLTTDERTINYMKKRIAGAGSIVAILGVEMLVESGGYDLDANDQTYRVEDEYGYSPEDMLTTSFFNARVEKFFTFYKREVVGMQVRSTPAYDALLKLQAQGKLSAVVSRNYHGLPAGVPLRNVIEYNGNMHVNHCPRCGRRYELAYIRSSRGIPLCEDCKTAIRPGIRLLGERADTTLMTKAALACERADVLLILGRNMYADRFEYSIGLDKKQLRVLFSKETALSDQKVDFIIRDEIQIILPLIV
ncbi:MAG: hypothetical protein NC337_11620 [Roseburia sp.]|nr:hypothetical protein [Roseburia sp.]